MDGIIGNAELTFENIVRLHAGVSKRRFNHLETSSFYTDVSLVGSHAEGRDRDCSLARWRDAKFENQFLNNSRIKYVHRTALTDLSETDARHVRKIDISVR